MYGPKNEGGRDDDSPTAFSARNGKSVTFVLDTSTNKLGYTIDSIKVYTGYFWYRTRPEVQGRVLPGWTGGLALLAGGDVRPSSAWDSGFWEACSHIRNRVRAPLATHVNRIRFTFYDQNKGLSGGTTRLTPAAEFRHGRLSRDRRIRIANAGLRRRGESTSSDA